MLLRHVTAVLPCDFSDTVVPDQSGQSAFLAFVVDQAEGIFFNTGRRFYASATALTLIVIGKNADRSAFGSYYTALLR
jgi:hypothetical protein